MRTKHRIQTLAGLVVLALALAFVLLAVFGWNWLRAPIERATLAQTGRALAIEGDLTWRWSWPLPHLQANGVRFANPAWASQAQMLSADTVDITIDLSQAVQGRLTLPDVTLGGATVWLEQGADGRKSWLLDRQQQDENATIRIDRLRLAHVTLGYDDALHKTLIRAVLSTPQKSSNSGDAPDVVFNATGTFRGLALKAVGNAGPILGLRDEASPYPLTLDATLGQTRARLHGSVTGLLDLTTVDAQLELEGASMDQLYVVLGIALPRTGDYATAGHLAHHGGRWNYNNFTARIGKSDLAGSLQVDTAGQRPSLRGELHARVIEMADLGPLIGARQGTSLASAAFAPARKKPPARARILPDLPFDIARWDSVDADVTFKADNVRSVGFLPLKNLNTHLQLRDAVLTLDPLELSLAGGQLAGAVSLDGGKNPIQAHARMNASQLQMAQLFPDLALGKSNIGQLTGAVDLTGSGNSIGGMLAHASGKTSLVIADGEISQLMMEKVGLHLWEILQLNLSGDQLVKLRCAVADFDVSRGNMQVDALVFDTAVTTIRGSGRIDLASEMIDLTLQQRTKNTSPLALRSPIHISGSLGQPLVQVDKTLVAVRAIGALALGVVNPLLALLPLIDAGPGRDSDCALLVREARGQPKTK